MPSNIRGSDDFDSAKAFGQNQTWQDVSASRSVGTLYTNDTGKAIAVSWYSGGSTESSGYVDGMQIVYALCPVGVNTPLFMIVPNGSTYQVNTNAYEWRELR